MARAILHAHGSSSTTDVIECYQAERRAVSNRMYSLLHGLVLLLTGCSICIAGAYAWGLGEGVPQSAILTATAVGIEVALVFFAAVMYPRAVMAAFGLVAGVGVLLISILTITSFLLSQQHQQEHQAIKQREEYRASLVADKAKLDISDTRDRGSIAILNNRIEQADEEIARLKRAVPETKSTAIYHYLAKSTGYTVEAVSLALRGLYGLIVVCTAVALAGYLETIYSPRSLGVWLNAHEVQVRTINGARERLQAIGQGSESSFASLEATQVHQIASNGSEGAILAGGSRHRRAGEYQDIPEKLYQKVRLKVGGIGVGEAVPVREIRGVVKKSDYAYSAIDRLVEEGLVVQGANGRYLKSK